MHKNKRWYFDSVLLSIGNQFEIRAFGLLNITARQFLSNLIKNTMTEIVDCGDTRELTTAEAFLLVRVCGPVAASAIIAKVDLWQYPGNLVCFLQSEMSKCKKIEQASGKFTPVSLDAFLLSPLFGGRPAPIKTPRKSRKQTAQTDQDPSNTPEISFGHFLDESEVNSSGEYDMSGMPTALFAPENDADSLGGTGDSDHEFAVHLNVALNHETFDATLQESLQFLSDQNDARGRKRARISLVEPAVGLTLASESPPFLFPVGAIVRVLARTFSGVSPREANSFVATFLRRCDGPDGAEFCFVIPMVERRRKQKVRIDRVVEACFDGIETLSRNGRPSSEALKIVREAEKARLDAEKAKLEAEKAKLEIEKQAARDARRAQAELKHVKTQAAARVKKAFRMARVEVNSVRAKLKAAVDGAVLDAKIANLAKADLKAYFIQASFAARRIVRRTTAQCNFLARREAQKAKRHSRIEIAAIKKVAQRAQSEASVAAADATELRRSRGVWQRSQLKQSQERGRSAERVAFDDASVKIRRAEAGLEHERRMGKRAKVAFQKAFSDVEDKALHLRALKNEMAKRARLVEKKMLKMKKAKANMDEGMKKKSISSFPKAIQERLNDAQADVFAAEEAMAAMQEEIDRLRKDNCNLAQAHRLLKLKSGAAGVDFQKRPIDVIKTSKVELWQMLGVRGGSYCQDIIELGLTLMAAQLSAEQAVDVLRAFLRLEYPTKIEGTDYRIPDASRFREWRRYLEPISHFIGLSVIKLSGRNHVSHDATTKNGVHVLQTCVRCEITNGSGEVMVVDVPLKFEICPSGEAKHEAKHISDAFHSPLLGGLHAALTSVVSATSDNAARATSRALEILKAEEVTAVRLLLTPSIGEIVDANSPELQAAVEAFLAMTPEQQEHAHEMHELGCTGHSLNLTVDDCWAKSEASTLTTNMVRHRAALVLTRAVLSFLRKKCPKRLLHFSRCVEYA
jgi:hypothetical protein